MIRRKKHSQQGFTIVELMVSTVIFSLVLVAAMAGLVQIGRLYYRGVTQARTQEVTRSVIEEISQAIQFSKQDVEASTFVSGPEVSASSNPVGFFCVGVKRYTYAMDRQVKESPNTGPTSKEIRHGLWVDEPSGGCSVGGSVGPANLANENPSTGANGRSLLDENMRLTNLSLAQVNGDDNFWRVRVAIAYGDDDLLSVSADDRRVCEGSTSAIEFCAISELSTTVLRRVQ